MQRINYKIFKARVFLLNLNSYEADMVVSVFV